MKELTIEQKAKAYDEALERARKLHKDAIYMDDNVHIKQYESIFPELKENDEKIKKALIDIVYDTIGDSFWVDYGVHKEEAVAWLEKQHNEQKPVVDSRPKGWYISSRYKEIAWSENDEYRAKLIIYFLETAKKHYASTVELDACIDWLKSLKEKVLPKNIWKPSGEQILAFEHFVRNVMGNSYNSSYKNKTNVLYSLLNDLKRLKG